MLHFVGFPLSSAEFSTGSSTTCWLAPLEPELRPKKDRCRSEAWLAGDVGPTGLGGAWVVFSCSPSVVISIADRPDLTLSRVYDRAAVARGGEDMASKVCLRGPPE